MMALLLPSAPSNAGEPPLGRRFCHPGDWVFSAAKEATEQRIPESVWRDFEERVQAVRSRLRNIPAYRTNFNYSDREDLMEAGFDLLFELKNLLSRYGIESRVSLDRRRENLVLIIEDIPQHYWLGRIISGVNRNSHGTHQPMTLSYDPLFDFIGRPQANLNPRTRHMSMNSHVLGQSLTRGRSEVVLHEITHDRMLQIERSLLTPPAPGTTRTPPPPRLGFVEGGGHERFPWHPNYFALDELWAYRKSLLQFQSTLTRPTSAGPRRIESRRKYRDWAKRLVAFGNSIDYSVSSMERSLRGNFMGLDITLTVREEANRLTYAVVRMPDGLNFNIPLPVELVGDERATKQYLYDYFIRLREVAREARAIGASAITVP